MRKHNEALEEALDELIDDVVRVAEKERGKDYINDDGDLFCLMDTLRHLYYNYIDKAYHAKRVDTVQRLHKRFKKYWR